MSDKLHAFGLRFCDARQRPWPWAFVSRLVSRFVWVWVVVGLGVGSVQAGASSAQDETTNPAPDTPADWLSHLNPDEAGDHVQAYQDHVERVLAGDDAAALRQLAVMAGYAEDWALAGTAAARFRQHHGINEVVAIEIDAWTRLDRMDTAQATLGTLLNQAPSAWTGWARLGKVLRFIPDQDKALVLLDRLDQALELGEHRPAWLTARAQVLDRLAQPTQALRTIEAAIELEITPDRVAYAVDLATDSGEFERALAWVKQLPAEAQQRPEFGLAHAQLLIAMDEPQAALAVFESTTPTAEVLFRTAELAQALGDADRIEVVWAQMPTSGEDISSKDAYYIGHTAQLMQNYGQAFAWFGRVKERPWAHEAALARGHLLLEFGRAQGWGSLTGSLDKVRQALADVRRGTDDEQDIQHAWALEISLLKEAGLTDQAIDKVTDGLSAQPDDEFLLYMRAMVAIGVDRPELAEQDLRRLIRLDRDNADALNALGYMLIDEPPRLREAYWLIHRAWELAPDSPAILDSLGWVNFQLGRVDVAHGFLDKAYAMQPDPEILGHLVEVLNAQGQSEKAQALLAEARDTGQGR